MWASKQCLFTGCAIRTGSSWTPKRLLCGHINKSSWSYEEVPPRGSSLVDVPSGTTIYAAERKVLNRAGISVPTKEVFELSELPPNTKHSVASYTSKPSAYVTNE